MIIDTTQDYDFTWSSDGGQVMQALTNYAACLVHMAPTKPSFALGHHDDDESPGHDLSQFCSHDDHCYLHSLSDALHTKKLAAGKQ